MQKKTSDHRVLPYCVQRVTLITISMTCDVKDIYLLICHHVIIVVCTSINNSNHNEYKHFCFKFLGGLRLGYLIRLR